MRADFMFAEAEMKNESEIRLENAICGAPPDRAPTAPLLYYFAAAYAGISCEDLVHRPIAYREAVEKCWEDLGPWDVYYPLNAISRDVMSLAMPMKAVYPGEELPPNETVQFLEEEIMTPEDYEWLLEPLAPSSVKELRAGLRRGLLDLLRRGPGDPDAGKLRFSIDTARSALSGFFHSAYGDRRETAEELRTHAAFARTLARLLRDPALDPDFFFRYCLFATRMAARVRGRSNVLENAALLLRGLVRQLDFTKYDVAAWKKRGAAPLFGMGFEGPFDSFSMARSMIPFTTGDLFDRQREVKWAAILATDFFVAMAELGTALTGVPRFIYAAHRTSNDFISPTHFMELAFPAMRMITEAITERGITMIFHCDGMWNFNLEYLAALPEGKCVFQFDGRTDMRLAREKLGPGHCIFGDVPATLLAHGEPDEVRDYCRGLLRDIGAEGRFILGAGCEVPPDAKPENVRAMLRAPEE